MKCENVAELRKRLCQRMEFGTAGTTSILFNPICSSIWADTVTQQFSTTYISITCIFLFFYDSGLRARMGAGNAMMNDLTIIQTTQVRGITGILLFNFDEFVSI